jgi:cyclase
MLRIIPRLDIKGPNLVKGIHLEGLRVLGPPEVFARLYYEQSADEIFLQDVVASLYGRNSIHNIITKIAKEVFIPITVGGGIRTLEDIRLILRAGADKVSINTAGIKNPLLIRDASRAFGSSTIVVAIEAIKQLNGKYLAYFDNGREQSRFEVNEWAKMVQDYGAGELILTSVDREGTGEGFDYDLINGILKSVEIPVIVHGGAGSIEDVVQVLDNTMSDSLALGSLLHYNLLDKMTEENWNSEGNYTFLKSGVTKFHKIKSTDIIAMKNELKLRGHKVRL